MIDKPGGERAVTQGGFEAALEGLQVVRGKTQWINQQVSAGKLALDPEVAEKAAKRVEEEIQELAVLMRDARQLGRVVGLGNYPDGQQLTQRFVDKAEHETAGALPLIKEMQKVLQEQADAFRAAARDYRATDDQIAQDLQRGIQ
ncbi:hypothetical protein ACH347_35020 [Saccharopolyspora sp. 5N102]|uniref:hypothetical protein n=1 Tax=Saccharopolyspora sp. 5N102 TaxID=3375155 RepID=UPI0037AF35EB